MTEASPDQLKHAVESQHGGTATHLQSVPVHEAFRGETGWNGAMQVFDLKDIPGGATQAYAWLSPIKGSTNRRFFAVLHVPRITKPRDAVGAATAAEARAGK